MLPGADAKHLRTALPNRAQEPGKTEPGRPETWRSTHRLKSGSASRSFLCTSDCGRPRTATACFSKHSRSIARAENVERGDGAKVGFLVGVEDNRLVRTQLPAAQTGRTVVPKADVQSDRVGRAGREQTDPASRTPVPSPSGSCSTGAIGRRNGRSPVDSTLPTSSLVRPRTSPGGHACGVALQDLQETARRRTRESREAARPGFEADAPLQRPIWRLMSTSARILIV